jgi:hypothetical protein
MAIKLSTILFYLIAAYCVIVGAVNQTITTVDDLPWVALALADSDVTAFNPILAIWARWIGMFLITAGIALIAITPAVHNSTRNLVAAGALSIGTVGAQCFSVLSLGAFGPVVFVLLTATACAVAAPLLGLYGARNNSVRA